MPEETQWESYFNPVQVLDRLHFGNFLGPVVEFGCGYGTFTIPAAQASEAIVYAFDIELDMITRTSVKARDAGLSNVLAEVRDFVTHGTGLEEANADYCMLFNILHLEQPARLLSEALRILKPGKLLGILHWNYDPKTPRGPTMEIRPRPEQCQAWAVEAGFQPVSGLIDLPPFHYGLVFKRPQSSFNDTAPQGAHSTKR